MTSVATAIVLGGSESTIKLEVEWEAPKDSCQAVFTPAGCSLRIGVLISGGGGWWQSFKYHCKRMMLKAHRASENGEEAHPIEALQLPSADNPSSTTESSGVILQHWIVESVSDAYKTPQGHFRPRRRFVSNQRRQILSTQ